MNTSELVEFLKKQTVKASFTDKLKITYRPYICPFDKVLGFIEPGDAVADIGCGSGQLALLMAEFTKPSRITGIEISQKLIDNAQTLLASYTTIPCQFSVFDGETFPEAIHGCQKYFMVDVLHHVPKDSQVSFLKKLYNLMPTGSKLILKDINGASPFVYFNKLHDMIFAGEIGNEMSIDTAVKTLTEIGFTVEHQTTEQLYVYPHYTIVAKK
jgi:cyclopropane fatty-acyl-phospholipid synthase-like methyltransferase